MPTKRAKKQRKRGAGFKDDLVSALKNVGSVAKDILVEAKNQKVLSNVLKNVEGLKPAGELASAVGLGKTSGTAQRKRKPRAKKRNANRGGSLLGDILGKITSIPAGALMGFTAGTQNAISGLGRARRRGGMRDMTGELALRQPALLPNARYSSYA